MTDAWARVLATGHLADAFRKGSLYGVSQVWRAKPNYYFDHGFVRNHFDEIDAFMAANAGVNVADTQGMTPLMYSTGMASLGDSDHLERVRYLIANGADLDTRDVNGHTAAYLACRPKRSSTRLAKVVNGAFELLVNAGANLELTYDDEKMTLLHIVVDSTSYDADKALMLLAKGANPDVGDANGVKPLLRLMSSMQDFPRLWRGRHPLIVNELLKRDVDITQTTIHGCNVFHLVCDLDVLDMLIAYASAIGHLDLLNAKCVIGQTPLGHLVVKYASTRYRENTDNRRELANLGRRMMASGALVERGCLHRFDILNDEFMTSLREEA